VYTGGCTIRGLRILNCAYSGVQVSGPDCTVAGCHSVSNGNCGVYLYNATGCTIGGTDEADRNVLSANVFAGVFVSGTSCSNNTVLGNYIGVDASGLTAFGNDNNGVNISLAQNTTIGGAAVGAGNVISANGYSGVHIGNASTGTVVQGNYVGVAADGSTALPNAWTGITAGGITLYTSGNTIGGMAAGEGNVISGNAQSGVYVTGTNAFGNLIMGNTIGLAADGMTAVGNGRHGVCLYGASSNTVGGLSPAAGNFIAYNTWSGVCVVHSNSMGNAILGNSIYGNAKLGIDLVAEGENEISGIVEANDGRNYDLDSGPNGLQNYPSSNSVFQGAAGNSGVQGVLYSKSNSSYRVEFFANPTSDPSNYGEGRYFIGFQNVTTDAGGRADLSVTLGPSMAKGHVVTATATDSENNTSEFSRTGTNSFIDADNDNIEFWWEYAHGMSDATNNSGDIDFDGFSDLDEYYGNTNPTNHNDVPQIISNTATPSVSFDSSITRLYRLQMAQELDDPTEWRYIGPQLPGNGGVMSLSAPPGSDRGFYRVETILP